MVYDEKRSWVREIVLQRACVCVTLPIDNFKENESLINKVEKRCEQRTQKKTEEIMKERNKEGGIE